MLEILVSVGAAWRVSQGSKIFAKLLQNHAEHVGGTKLTRESIEV